MSNEVPYTSNSLKTQTALPEERVKYVNNRPVQMKLFASWEVGKITSNCVPRLCTLRLTRLVVARRLESDLQAVIIAVKMQSSKRVLRSNEVTLNSDGTADVELDLFFSLQYPHFLKRDCNKLQILLQRRKKYRTIPGYKTLVLGTVDMAGVLQHSRDEELMLFSLKDGSPTSSAGATSLRPAAAVSLVALASQPVDHAETPIQRNKQLESEDEELSSSQDEASDDYVEEKHRRKKDRHSFARRHQRNLKQRFVNLLKRFRAAEEVLESEPDLVTNQPTRSELDDLFDELEEFSDSGPELYDTSSIRSTPKPSIRPFFVKRSKETLVPDTSPTIQEFPLASDDSSKKQDSDAGQQDLSDHSDVTGAVEDHLPLERATVERRSSKKSERKSSLRKQSKNNERNVAPNAAEQIQPSKSLLERLSALAPADDVAAVPNTVLYYDASDTKAQAISNAVWQQFPSLHLLPSEGLCDAKTMVSRLLHRIIVFTNQSSREPCLCQVAVCGSDSFLSILMQCYVQEASLRVIDWSSYIRFFYIPTGSSHLARQLGQGDPFYSSLFCDTAWRELCEMSSVDLTHTILLEASSRIKTFLSCDTSPLRLPLGEALITRRPQSVEDEAQSRLFIPFICDVRVGIIEVTGHTTGTGTGSSGEAEDNPSLRDSPPPSPRVKERSSETDRSGSGDAVELQLEYWTASRPTVNTPAECDTSKKDRKDSQRTGTKLAVKALKVYWQVISGEGKRNDERRLCLTVVPKEKKQKIIKFPKRSNKNEEVRNICVANISRMLCSTKQGTFSVLVDGREYKPVKFFQIVPQWHSHIKSFPLAESS